jgi:glycosyltransferase involved in cell wall biosynthesis
MTIEDQVSTSSNQQPVVALVANQTWSILNYRLPLIRTLHAAGIRVHVFAPVDESLSQLLAEPGVEFTNLRHFKRNTVQPIANIRILLELKRQLKALKPQLVINFGVQANIFGNLAAQWARCPSMCVVTGLGYAFLHNGIIPKLVSLLYRLSFSFAAQVLFENQEDLELMVKRGLVDLQKTHRVSGCGIDTEYFQARPLESNGNKQVFTFIGRLLYDKGLREFAHAARVLKKAYPNSECWVLGQLDQDNPAHIDRSELVDWVRSGTVRYLGSRKDVRPVIAASNWIVLPSYREGLSRVLLEAMSMEKPVITSQTPGCSETVDHGKNGYLVPIKNADALADAMGLACGISLKEQKEMGAWGRKKVLQKYQSERVGAEYLQLILPFVLPMHANTDFDKKTTKPHVPSQLDH